MGIVGPGDTIELKDGIYEEHLKSVSGGEEGNPIRIVGGLGAVINPHADNGYSRAVQIFHSYIHIIVSLNTRWMTDGSYRAHELLRAARETNVLSRRKGGISIRSSPNY